jgi:hypothetical protein
MTGKPASVAFGVLMALILASTILTYFQVQSGVGQVQKVSDTILTQISTINKEFKDVAEISYTNTSGDIVKVRVIQKPDETDAEMATRLHDERED